MGFFKDFADDFQEAVDELIPGGENLQDDDSSEVVKKTASPIESLETDIDADEELSKLDGLLERASANMNRQEAEIPAPEPVKVEPVRTSAPVAQPTVKEQPVQPVPVRVPSFVKENEPYMSSIQKETIEMDEKLNLDTTPKTMPAPVAAAPVMERPSVSDENAVITSGMRITGDLESTGSIEVEGTINGNVTCNGKLTVTGVLNGNSNSSEFFADQAKVQGEVASTGTVKIGVGSVVIGNITASSAVIAGAVKGDIDVQGPVVVDTSAVVMGNIKSRSVQINNGAVIEGFCSQSYAEVDVESVFA